jgi:winged helix DNA-binding protein
MVPISVSWAAALAWRMERQLLEPVGRASIVDVVRRLGGVQAQVASSADLAIRLRRDASHAGDAERAVADGRLIKTWAMRGALHLLAPDHGAALLSLIAATRPWTRPGWDRYFEMDVHRWDAFRGAVREALDGATLTREELTDAIVGRSELEPLAGALRSGWGTILKPLAWQGELCFGPSRGTRVTFRRPADAAPGWAGLPAPEEAAPIAVETYFGAYGPARLEAFTFWMGGGWLRSTDLRRLVEPATADLVEVNVEGRRAYVLTKHADSLASARPSRAVRLLPGFDAWILGPGSKDERVIPPARRTVVSRQAGWISPVVVLGGVVAGTWRLDRDRVAIRWFLEAGEPPRSALADEVDRLSRILGRSLDADVTTS